MHCVPDGRIDDALKEGAWVLLSSTIDGVAGVGSPLINTDHNGYVRRRHGDRESGSFGVMD